MFKNINQGPIQLQPLETNLDHEVSKSQESIYSVESYLYSIEDRSIDSILQLLFLWFYLISFLGCFERCLTRIPYATLIATIMCALGVVIFCGTMYRGATLAVLMFTNVFSMQLIWLVYATASIEVDSLYHFLYFTFYNISTKKICKPPEN